MNADSDTTSLPIAEGDRRYLALFDFDGTISKRDSMLAFILFTHSTPKIIFNSILFLPVFIVYGLKIIDNEKAKILLLKLFFKSWRKEEFEKYATQFSVNVLDKLVRCSARDRLSEHLKAGHEVVVVSASLSDWLAPWCEKNSLALLATHANFSESDEFKGIQGNNCHGKEKVRRIVEKYKLETYALVYAYGDSRGDNEMLKLANISQYKPFRLR